MECEFHTHFQAQKPESQRVPLSSLSQPVNPAVSLNETVLLVMTLPCGFWNRLSSQEAHSCCSSAVERALSLGHEARGQGARLLI